MARTRKTEQESTSAPHGEGGSYVIDASGNRVLVERTEHRVVKSVELEEREAKTGSEPSGETQSGE